MHHLRPYTPILYTALFCLPGLALRLFHAELSPPMATLVSGAAILAASFILLWACDVAQMDVSRTLALAVVALIAVLPEYAVDMYFTWQAGKNPGSDYAHYAIANMTGANRLLIGVAWASIAGICWLRTRRAVDLEPSNRTDIAFLGMATLYAFFVSLKESLAWYDGLVFIGLYVWYIRLVSKRPCADCEPEGPAEAICRLPATQRKVSTLVMFLFAAGVILADAEIFSEGLVATGKVFGINEFLLVQWLAPIASEAPEFIVAIMLALRGQAGVALASLLSAKLNQWTLLVGMIPGVYGIAAGTFATPIPLATFQMHELLLTAAQSLLAMALLTGLRLTPRGAMLLFGMFMGQFVAAPVLDYLHATMPALPTGDQVHVGFSAAYVALALAVGLTQPGRVIRLREGLRDLP